MSTSSKPREQREGTFTVIGSLAGVGAFLLALYQSFGSVLRDHPYLSWSIGLAILVVAFAWLARSKKDATRGIYLTLAVLCALALAALGIALATQHDWFGWVPATIDRFGSLGSFGNASWVQAVIELAGLGVFSGIFREDLGDRDAGGMVVSGFFVVFLAQALVRQGIDWPGAAQPWILALIVIAIALVAAYTMVSIASDAEKEKVSYFFGGLLLIGILAFVVIGIIAAVRLL